MNSNLGEFFRRASFYRYHKDFDEFERLYKVRLENGFSASRSLLRSDPTKALELFRRTLKSQDNNIIDWRDNGPLFKWIVKQPDSLLTALEVLWDQKLDIELRFSSFCEALSRIGIRQPGGRLAVTSTLLMTFSANEFPPVKTEPFIVATRVAGWEGFNYKLTPAQRYERALSFMDMLLDSAGDFHVDLRDRLDAQGVIWCLYGGWRNIPLPDGWVNDPERRLRQQQLRYASELAELDAEPESDQLSITQKLALVQVRRGQDKFREDLVKLWSTCAVTSCSELSFLRASHIKSWKDANNRERLDPFNGLLLSPNLDVAFDNGLITFDDDGRIRISKQLSAQDRKLLGITASLRLRAVDSKHIPYLQYHRNYVFKQETT